MWLVEIFVEAVVVAITKEAFKGAVVVVEFGDAVVSVLDTIARLFGGSVVADGGRTIVVVSEASLVEGCGGGEVLVATLACFILSVFILFASFSLPVSTSTSTFLRTVKPLNIYITPTLIFLKRIFNECRRHLSSWNWALKRAHEGIVL